MFSLSRLWRLVGRRMSAGPQLEVRCPVCGHAFLSREPATGAFASGRIQSCSRCGYYGARHHFAVDAGVSLEFKTHLLSELARKVTRRPATGSEKYEAAAKLAERRMMDARRVGDLLLRAAWCCVDEKDSEAERFFRRLAARKFEEALQRFDGVPRHERALLTYLVGELWRRIGDGKRASEWFNRVSAEVEDARAQRWVIDAARQQRDCPEEWVR